MLKAKQHSTGFQDNAPPESCETSLSSDPQANNRDLIHADDETKRCGEELERILSSSTFQRSKKLKQLLTYIITNYLQGKSESLKEYTIGVDVFRRKSSFNPASDPIVRVEASRLRQQLEKYYLREGLADPLEIHIPRGTYVPMISLQHGISHHTSNAPTEYENAVLVLPFVLFDDHRPSAITDTLILTDPLLYGLTRQTSLHVVPRIWGINPDYMLNAGEMTRKHKVRFVVEGSIVTSSGRCRVFVHVSDMQLGQNLWSEKYEVAEAILPETAEKILHDLLRELNPAGS